MAAPRRPPSAPKSHDPIVPSGHDLTFGGNAMRAPQNIVERGVVLSVDALRHTYTVHFNSGRTLDCGRVRNHPGDLSLLPVGTVVVVTHAMGAPYILGVLPPDTEHTDDENPHSITDTDGFGGQDALLNRALSGNARGKNEPTDVGPGDFVGMSPDGASVAALHGRVAQLRGSALAKVQAFGDNDLVQIIAGVLRVVTWMGESRVVNNGGKTSFIWRGGSDQLTQTGPDEEKFTIKLDVGHTGNMIKLEVCNRAQQPLFHFHVNPAGKLDIFAAGGVAQHAGASAGQLHPVNFHGSVQEVVTGGASRRVGGDVSETHEGSRTETVSGDYALSVGQDHVANVSRNYRRNTGGDDREFITGKKRVESGDEHLVEVLGPAKGYTLKTRAGEVKTETRAGAYTVLTLGGGISLNAGAGTARVTAGVFAIDAPTEQITLGTGAALHATKWETLNTQMLVMVGQISALNALVATHIHPPGVPAPAPTLAPLANPVLLDLSTAKSGVKVV